MCAKLQGFMELSQIGPWAASFLQAIGQKMDIYKRADTKDTLIQDGEVQILGEAIPSQTREGAPQLGFKENQK